jgi:hypothetical protein
MARHFEDRPSAMRRQFREAVKSLDGPDSEMLWLGVMNGLAGFCLGAEMYQSAAAIRRAMIACGLPAAGLLEALLEDADVH